jgi:UPF0042 nucleotide-binding protein
VTAATSPSTQVVILTGVSGSGKTTALRALEDAGFYCIDNLPIVLLDKLLELTGHTAGEVSRIATVVDARDTRFLGEAPRIVGELRQRGIDLTVLFLDCDNEAVVRRYSETRRRHPMAGQGGTVQDGITAERQALESLRGLADEVIDSTTLNVHDLKRLVSRRFTQGAEARLGVTVISFGFRYGLPSHADMVLDVRFLPNPYFVPALRPLTGLEPQVRDHVLEQPDAQAFLARLLDFAAFLLPRYRGEGKSYLTIAIGCTGGKHRSVVIAAELARRLEVAGQAVRLWHRDVEKE